MNAIGGLMYGVTTIVLRNKIGEEADETVELDASMMMNNGVGGLTVQRRWCEKMA